MSNKILQIKIGDAQPSPCSNCNEFYGYQHADHVKLHYNCFYDKDGVYEGGQYSEYANTLHKGVSAFCCNCGKRLPFKLIRD